MTAYQNKLITAIEAVLALLEQDFSAAEIVEVLEDICNRIEDAE